MTKREVGLGAALLVFGVVATHLWLQLREARADAAMSQASEPALVLERGNPTPVTPPVPVPSVEPASPPLPIQETVIEQTPAPAPAPVRILTAAPLSAADQALATESALRPEPDSVMQGNDLDRDGIITRDEARSAGKFLNLGWDNYDKNQDGVVDAGEIVQYNRATQGLGTGDGTRPVQVRPASINSILDSNDLNRDGVITREEATRANRLLVLSWDQYDVNKDGVVDAAELTRNRARAR